jgi:hypothetical protein
LNQKELKGDRLLLPVPFFTAYRCEILFFLMDTSPVAEGFRYCVGNRS